jgi:hypothetical protein
MPIFLILGVPPFLTLEDIGVLVIEPPDFPSFLYVLFPAGLDVVPPTQDKVQFSCFCCTSGFLNGYISSILFQPSRILLLPTQRLSLILQSVLGFFCLTVILFLSLSMVLMYCLVTLLFSLSLLSSPALTLGNYCRIWQF